MRVDLAAVTGASGAAPWNHLRQQPADGTIEHAENRTYKNRGRRTHSAAGGRVHFPAKHVAVPQLACRGAATSYTVRGCPRRTHRPSGALLVQVLIAVGASDHLGATTT